MGHEASRESFTALVSALLPASIGSDEPRPRGLASLLYARRHLSLVLALPMLVACGSGEASESPADEATADGEIETTHEALGVAPPPSGDGATTTNTPIGLAFEIENGVGEPVSVRAGQRFYINQIDITAQNKNLPSDSGISTLDQFGDFKNLQWQGSALRDESFASNMDGVTWTRRRFYRDAKWMESDSGMVVWQVDSQGQITAVPVILSVGKDNKRGAFDDFFIRRFRAIQFTEDCVSASSCEGAQKYVAEGNVELRNARFDQKTFKMQPRTTAFKLSWLIPGGKTYTIPVTQDPAPQFDYGFKIDVRPLTPPRSDGTYAAGSDIQFKVTLRDGAGQALHEDGTLPTYNQVAFGPTTSDTGITYWAGPFDKFATYWRRKHKERMFVAKIQGPAQQIAAVHSVLNITDFLFADIQTTATLANDGSFAQARLFPRSSTLFTGQWNDPQVDTWTFHLPEDAPAGTYYVTTKARRVYKGQDIPASSEFPIQVGSTQVTQRVNPVGPCTSCHSQGGELSKILHANGNLATCSGCHQPMSFELDNAMYVRVHYIHSRSDRFGPPGALKECKNCHVDRASIQRTSKSACLSCHKSYPDSHVQQFGPITDNYVGGGVESFEQCTSSCHTDHPGGGL